MYPGWVLELLVGVNLLGLLGLGFIFWKERGSLHKLFPKSGERDIRNKFQEVLLEIEDFKRQNLNLNKSFRSLFKEGLNHIQRVSILRYNPYEDTGGDQSFSIAILSGNLDGMILTSLHSRSGTRVYVKPVVNGKSEVDLSKEESQVLSKAKNND